MNCWVFRQVKKWFIMSEITLKINDRFHNRKIKFFNGFEFDFGYDSVGSTFSFDFYFDPNNPEHKEIACLTHYHEVQVFYGKQLILTGVVTNNKFNHASVKELTGFSGYSKPGILQDVSIPPEIYPLQSDGLSISTIAKKAISPWVSGQGKSYKLSMAVDDSVMSKMTKLIEKSTANETDKIKDYLHGLCAPKDIIMSHNEKGELLFTSAQTKKPPILEFDSRKGMMPGTKFSLDYDGTVMHSHIHVKKSAAKDGGNAGDDSIKNPYVPFIYRPTVVTQSSGDDNDTAFAARRELGKELESGIGLTITTDRWTSNDGMMLLPNNLISVYDPEIYLYKRTNWFIRGINYKGDEKSTTATIRCVLPECYNTDKVVSIFRNINEHAQS